MKKDIEINADVGSIKFIQGSIEISNFNIDEVIAIGEVTTENGPLQDDHFLVFITKNKCWHSISTDSYGFNNLIKFLGSQLGVSAFTQLANVTSYKSRLVYPKEFEGVEFMETQVIKPRNLLDRLLMFVGSKNNWQVIMTSEAQEKIFPEWKRIEEHK